MATATTLTDHTRSVHVMCMHRTISLRIEAYERLRAARRHPRESFSDVVMRAEWPDTGITAGALLELYRESGAFLSDETLDRIEEAKAADGPPVDKWSTG